MNCRKNKYYYLRNLEIGIIMSLIVLLILFIYFPNFETGLKPKRSYPEPFIRMIDIPNTKQEIEAVEKLKIPRVESNLFIPEFIEDDFILDDIAVESTSIETAISDNQSANETPYEMSSLPFIPRQILEVIPENKDEFSGAIRLKLLIGKNGKVSDHKLLTNTSQNEKCLTSVLDAVYKSKWEPIKIEGNKIEYWIEKVYSFN